jgi:hypothetical protein
LATLAGLGEERTANVGDLRSGSTKRCATAVEEGTWAVQLIHAHLEAHPAKR